MGRLDIGPLYRHGGQQAEAGGVLQASWQRGRCRRALRAGTLARGSRYRRAHAGGDCSLHRGGNDCCAQKRVSLRYVALLEAAGPANLMSLPPESEFPSPRSIAGIVLAAGESSRMGADKALLIYRGRTFLDNIISSFREAGMERAVVVLGHHAELIQQLTDLSTVDVVVNQDYRRGQT